MYCNKPDSEKKWRLSCRDSNLREKRDEAVERKKFPAKILLKFQLGTNFQDGKKALKGLPTKLNKEKMITKLKFPPKKFKRTNNFLKNSVLMVHTFILTLFDLKGRFQAQDI